MRRPRLTALASFAACACALVAATPAHAAGERVPQGFVGSMIDGPMLDPAFDLDRETAVMARSGIESVRVAFQWVDAQPYERADQVPDAERGAYRDVGGVPTSFVRTDRLVATAARRRMRLLPAVTTSPPWAAKDPEDSNSSPPRATAEYASFLTGLVGRYGPRGTFWSENPTIPRRPIRTWQVWNEPNLRASWSDARWAPGYVDLLRSARAAIKSSDREATVVLAGLANRSFEDLGKIYRQAGARRLFDQVAIHPYTRNPRGVLRILRLGRRTMRRQGDARKPLLVTEFGWPSSRGKTKIFGFETTETGQAQRLRRVLPMLARARRELRLRAVYHYTWLGSEQRGGFSFSFSGLRKLGDAGAPVSKPALRTFREAALRLERCRRKSSVATRCVRRAP